MSKPMRSASTRYEASCSSRILAASPPRTLRRRLHRPARDGPAASGHDRGVAVEHADVGDRHAELVSYDLGPVGGVAVAVRRGTGEHAHTPVPEQLDGRVLARTHAPGDLDVARQPDAEQGCGARLAAGAVRLEARRSPSPRAACRAATGSCRCRRSTPVTVAYGKASAGIRFLRRSSAGSIASSAARWSNARSTRYVASGRPAPRYADTGVVLVIAPRENTCTRGMR